MRNFVFAGACALAFSYAQAACAGGKKHPEDHAPIGVMGDHLHKQGEWMVGYHYQHSRTSGYRNGSNKVSNASVMSAYGEAATEMDMGMHMLEIMYGISDDLTLMVMPQYMVMDMTHQSSHGSGHIHDHTTQGLGDTQLTGLYSIYDQEQAGKEHKVHVNMGVSLPTGSIDKTFVNHHDRVYPLPYQMQFGSGTFDPIIGATYNGSSHDWSWGAQTLNTIRLGKNDNGYRLGNKYTATTWIARTITDFASLSFRIDGEAWDDVSGRNARLPLTTIAGANPTELAGERVMANIGLNLLGDERLSDQRLAAEFGLPIYQRYSGPQPNMDYRVSLAWQWAF
ncbi:MAG: transporter [Alphaproteobacteria bacterium]|nr:MAG: transporter [Alphaproteobacteria bacterium]